MKDTKRRFETFSFYDRTSIEAHLEKMALRGWELEKVSSFGWRYRRCEPKKMHFIVTYYPKASAYDPEPTEGEQSFHEFCAEAGWRLMASSAQMQIFGNEKENPVPIETDAVLQVETIHNSVKKSYLLSYYLLLAVGLLNGVTFFIQLKSDPIGVLASNTNLFTGLCWVVLLFLCLVEIIGYFSWYRRAKAAAAFDGSYVKTRGHHRFQRGVLVVLLIALVFWLFSLGSSREKIIAGFAFVYMAAVIILVNVIRLFLKRKKAVAATSRAITIIAAFVMAFGFMGGLLFFVLDAVRSNSWTADHAPVETYEYRGITWSVYSDELPLVIEDLIDISYDEYSYTLTTKSSPLLTQIEASQRPRMDALDKPDLNYTITKVRLPLLYDFCLNSLLENYTDEDAVATGYRLVEQDVSDWEANEVYRIYSSDYPLDKYVICWPDRIAIMTFDWEITSSQIAIISDKLRAM